MKITLYSNICYMFMRAQFQLTLKTYSFVLSTFTSTSAQPNTTDNISNSRSYPSSDTNNKLQKVGGKGESSGEKEGHRGTGGFNPRCYNCGKMGHVAVQYDQQNRKRGSCYSCDSTEHVIKNCPNQKRIPAQEVAHVEEEEDDFYRVAELQLKEDGELYNMVFRVLLDSGSAVSLIKKSLVKPSPVKTLDVNSKQYAVINSSKLKLICCFGMRFVQKNNSFVEAANEILNVDVEGISGGGSAGVEINAEIDWVYRKRVQESFQVKYEMAKRSQDPQTKVERKISLREQQPFHFSPRRLSFTEKNVVKGILDKLIEQKRIRASQSKYVSPIVLTKKKERRTLDVR